MPRVTTLGSRWIDGETEAVPFSTNDSSTSALVAPHRDRDWLGCTKENGFALRRLQCGEGEH